MCGWSITPPWRIKKFKAPLFPCPPPRHPKDYNRVLTLQLSSFTDRWGAVNPRILLGSLSLKEQEAKVCPSFLFQSLSPKFLAASLYQRADHQGAVYGTFPEGSPQVPGTPLQGWLAHQRAWGTAAGLCAWSGVRGWGRVRASGDGHTLSGARS